MKQIGKDIITAVMIGVLLPAVALRLGAEVMERRQVVAQAVSSQVTQPQTQPITEAVVQATQAEDQSVFENKQMVRLLLSDGTTGEMEMEEYILGALMGEMAASFGTEALKAQAVAARTYAMKTVLSRKHGDGSLCTDFACCQAYISPEEYQQKGGSRESIQKFREAVDATSGQVLAYNGELIEATYFSCSGGRTEDAIAVWGSDVPYLRSVESPGEENAAHYTDEVFLSWDHFKQALDITATDIGEITYTDGGGVEYIVIGGRSFKGTRLRQLLNLRSTVFTLETGEIGVTIRTRGFGHRVGMSQYGADAMAAAGSDYRKILAHYYPGTALEEEYGCKLLEYMIK